MQRREFHHKKAAIFQQMNTTGELLLALVM